MKDFCSRAFHLTFAGALHSLLYEPRSIGPWPSSSDYRKALANPSTVIQVRGKLALRGHGETGETVVGIQLLVVPDWLNRLPIVFTDASFLRSERDWHVPVANLLCYGQDAEWRWKIEELWNDRSVSDAIIGIGSSWCIRNIDSLVTRHLHGHRFGISKWPKEWGQWSHGDDGVREFEEFVQRKRAA